MTNLDGLQTSNSPLPLPAAGVRSRNTASSGQANGLPENSTRLVTPSGNTLPPQAKPAPQSALQRTDQIEAAVEKLADFAQSLSRGLTFSVDDITGQTVIVVTDSESDEVVRQIPSEELLDLARKLQELQESQEKLESTTGNLLEVRV